MQEIPVDHLSEFYELSLDLFCLAGTDGYFKFLNKAWEDCLGYTRKELKSKPYIEFVHPDDRGATAVEAMNLSSGKLVLHFENRYITKDGNCKWLSWKASPQGNGEIYAVARDITSQKQEQIGIQTLLRKLELSNQELDRFAYIVSHDLKTPLRGIINLAEWIVEDLGPNVNDAVVGHVHLLTERVNWIQNLIDDLLKYARTGRNKTKSTKVNVVEVIDELRRMLIIPNGFQINVSPTLPTVLGERIELVQVFQNLLSNAIKYRSADDGWVSVSSEDAGEFWRFQVQDDGIGIHEKQHSKIFDIFYRLKEDHSVEGTGVGLAIVKKIIDAASGEIKVDSDGKSGTTFTFTWPKKYVD